MAVYRTRLILKAICYLGITIYVPMLLHLKSYQKSHLKDLKELPRIVKNAKIKSKREANGGVEIDPTLFVRNNSSVTDWQTAYELALLRVNNRLILTPDEKSYRLNNSEVKAKLPANLKEFKASLSPYAAHAFWHNSSFLVNSIRIPKSSSSFLSVIARTLAGCKPDGFPCCKGLGSPPGSCPRTDLFCESVLGCVDHRPTYSTYTITVQDDEVLVPAEPIITSFRHPLDRLMSAFFYYHPHRPKHTCFTWICFQKYVETDIYQNVLTKMMYGFYAYSALPSDIPLDTILKQAKMRLCHHTSWFGIAEMQIASQLLLYESEPFLWIKPNPALFNLPAEDVTSEQTVVRAGSDTKRTINIGLRINENESYEKFKARWGQTQELIDLVKSRNHLDYDLYEFALRLFCARLQETGLVLLSAYFKEDPFKMCHQQQGESFISRNTLSEHDLCRPFE